MQVLEVALSHDVRKSFSANEFYHFFFYIKDVYFPVANFVRLTSVFEELLV